MPAQAGPGLHLITDERNGPRIGAALRALVIGSEPDTTG